MIEWNSASGTRFVKNSPDVEIGFFYVDILDEMDTTCLKECLKNDECFVYEETVDGECAPRSLRLPLNHFSSLNHSAIEPEYSGCQLDAT